MRSKIRPLKNAFNAAYKRIEGNIMKAFGDMMKDLGRMRIPLFLTEGKANFELCDTQNYSQNTDFTNSNG